MWKCFYAISMQWSGNIGKWQRHTHKHIYILTHGISFKKNIYTKQTNWAEYKWEKTFFLFKRNEYEKLKFSN